MGVNLQEFMKDKVLGNVRSGTRGEDDRPIKLAYFDVHTDKSTSALAVELFNQAYNKPNKLKIRFINQHPIEIYLERYEGRKRKCYGNNKQAILVDDKGKNKVIECNANTCPYKQDRSCKFVARLYFIIENLEDEGVWCYPIGSQKGIEKISARIARANRKGEDLTKDWYELFLKAEDAPSKGKNYIPDIKKIEEIEENKLSEKSQESNVKEKLDYLMIKSFQLTIFEGKKVPKIIFVDKSSKEQELILMPESNQEILSLKPQSIILPTNISKLEKCTILNDYKIIKIFSEENKKAV